MRSHHRSGTAASGGGQSVILVLHGTLVDPRTCWGSCACATNLQRPLELPGPALGLGTVSEVCLNL